MHLAIRHCTLGDDLRLGAENPHKVRFRRRIEASPSTVLRAIFHEADLMMRVESRYSFK